MANPFDIDQVRVGDNSSAAHSNNTGWGQDVSFANRKLRLRDAFGTAWVLAHTHTELGTDWRQDVSFKATHTVRKHALGTRSIRIGDFCVVAVVVLDTSGFL